MSTYMNKIVVILFLVKLALFMSCTNSEKNPDVNAIQGNEKLIRINIDNIDAEQEVKYSSIFNEIRYIPLASESEEAIIGEISEAKLFEDKFFILDHLHTKKLFVFSDSGEFIMQIGSFGEGPGEFVDPQSFSIDETTKLVYILDPQLSRINVFSTNGEFEKIIPIITSPIVKSTRIEVNDGHIYLDAMIPGKELPNFMVREINERGEEVNYWLDPMVFNKGIDYSHSLLGVGKTFYNTTNDTKFVGSYMDTIFSLKGGVISPFLVLETQNGRLTNDDLDIANHIDENEREQPLQAVLVGMDKVRQIHMFAETDDLIYFRYLKGRFPFNVIYNKETKDYRIINYYLDDLTFSSGTRPTAGPEILTFDNQSIIGYIRTGGPMGASFLSEIENNDDIPKAELEKFRETFLSTENPILVSYSLK